MIVIDFFFVTNNRYLFVMPSFALRLYGVCCEVTEVLVLCLVLFQFSSSHICSVLGGWHQPDMGYGMGLARVALACKKKAETKNGGGE